MRAPSHITFTGADDATDLSAMRDLSTQYPIEWGILLAPDRHGVPRYPSWAFIDQLPSKGDTMKLAAHLCGGYAKSLTTGPRLAPEIHRQLVMRLGDHFQRVQVNLKAADRALVDRTALTRWCEIFYLAPILQCDGPFEEGPPTWLYDRSGGRGIRPDAWPTPAKTLCGYAGGIDPDNVVETLLAIAAPIDHAYWIDIESGVRDAEDRFSIEACRRVCEQVYGHGSRTRLAA